MTETSPTDVLSYTQASETLRLVAYDDATGEPVPEGGVIKGTLSNGWGHTGSDVYIGQVITEAQALAWLKRDLAGYQSSTPLVIFSHSRMV